MSLRKKIERAMGSEVELAVPPVDPMAQVVKEADTFGGQINALFAERNHYKKQCEWLMCQLEIAQRSLKNVEMERENWRRLTMTMVAANGELTSTINGLLSMGNNARNTLLRVEHLVGQLPKQPNPPAPTPQENGEEPVDLDAAFEQGAPEPTHAEIEQLRSTLASLPQQ